MVSLTTKRAHPYGTTEVAADGKPSWRFLGTS